MLRKRGKRLALIFAICLAPFWFLLAERFRGQYALWAYKNELASRGEILDFKKLQAARMAEADNGLAEFLRLASLLPNQSAVSDNHPPIMRMVGPGRAAAGFKLDSWISESNKKLSTNSWVPVAKDLESNLKTSEALRVVLKKTGFQSKVDYSHGFDFASAFAVIVPAKQMSQWFDTAAINALREGDHERALENIISGLHAARVLEKDGVAITELVRIAIGYIHFNASWEALQSNGWTEPQLFKLQQAWEATPFAGNMASSLRMERAVAISYYYPLMQNSLENARQTIFHGGIQGSGGSDGVSDFLEKQILARIWRFAWLHQDELYFLKEMQRIIDENTAGKSRRVDDPYDYLAFLTSLGSKPKMNIYDSCRYAMSASSIESLSRNPAKAARAETQKSLVIAAIAIMRHQLRYGKPPLSLAELAPEFIKSVPLDYMDGKPIKYLLRKDNNWSLYSVGVNGIDDHGDPAPVNPKTSFKTIWEGKDAIWPSLASPTEFSEFQKAEFQRKPSHASDQGSVQK